jgi:hypothetical protein
MAEYVKDKWIVIGSTSMQRLGFNLEFDAIIHKLENKSN